MKNKRKMSLDKVLLIILILSIFEMIFFITLKAGVFQKNAPALKEVACILTRRYSYIFDMVNSISMAYIMSYIFYAVALIPERKKQQSINKYINIYLSEITQLLENIIQVSNEFINQGNKDLKASPKIISVLRKNTGKVEFLSYREHFIKFYQDFTKEYQHVSYYIAFIDDGLRDCLYEIVTCSFYNRIDDLLIKGDNGDFDKIFEDSFDINVIKELVSQLKQF